jgi:hypothetical protein
MKTAVRLLVPVLVGSLASVGPATADDKFTTRLSGYNEVHFSPGPPAALRGAVSTPARGKFEARIDRSGVIHYELEYEGLTGSVTQAHIHFGQRHTVGGIVVWLCQTEGVPAPDAVAEATPMCPNAGSVAGTITPAQVLAATEQGIAAGAFDDLVEAIRAGRAYANVHSAAFPPGEIRGQIHKDHHGKDHHGKDKGHRR